MWWLWWLLAGIQGVPYPHHGWISGAQKTCQWNQQGNRYFSGLHQSVVSLSTCSHLPTAQCSWLGRTGTSPGLSSDGQDGETGRSGICLCEWASCTLWCPSCHRYSFSVGCRGRGVSPPSPPPPWTWWRADTVKVVQELIHLSYLPTMQQVSSTYLFHSQLSLLGAECRAISSKNSIYRSTSWLWQRLVSPWPLLLSALQKLHGCFDTDLVIPVAWLVHYTTL